MILGGQEKEEEEKQEEQEGWQEEKGNARTEEGAYGQGEAKGFEGGGT